MNWRTDLAFFDVDSLECGEGCAFAYRPRMEPLRAQLDELHELAGRENIRTLYCTCCSGRMLAPGENPDVLFVPLDETQTAWRDELDAHRMIYLAKAAFGSPERNAEHQAWDMFAFNKNAAPLLRALDIPHWIVFGNALELCVDSAVQGLLAAGMRVTVVADVLASSAIGDEHSRREKLRAWREQGVETISLAQCRERLRPSSIR
ncbi:MAG TPA: isochorismatase family protein [bacterium]|nr:isochorismatase family protein [bacterium]